MPSLFSLNQREQSKSSQERVFELREIILPRRASVSNLGEEDYQIDVLP